MYIILVYDVHADHIKHVSKVCEAYLTRTQRSVFEGNVSQSDIEAIKNQLAKLIDVQTESVLIYSFENSNNIHRQALGQLPEFYIV